MIDAPLGNRSRWRPRWPDVEDLVRSHRTSGHTCREGRDVTVVTYGRMVPVAMQAAENAAGEGVDTEVIDLRSLAPYDWERIKASVRKTRTASSISMKIRK
jgi:2-oxoisovalerate dehydrogenase E1 component beta subunit